VKGSAYTLGYAAVLGVVCASLLTGAASFTEDYRKANAKAEEVLNILLVLNVSLPAEPSSEELVEIYKEKVKEKVLEQELGDIVKYVYSPQPPNKDGAIAIRFAGPGLWGPIKGFLALDPEEETIRGITFYEQEETPGLGGEIVTEGFRKRFVGKTIHDKDDNLGIVICKPGSAKEQNEIDGITGATMTCNKVQAMLNEAIKSIVEEKQ